MVKIVICGAGISGLSAYLLLQKHLNAASSSSPHEIKIYEAYDISKPNLKNNDAAAGRSKTPIVPVPSQDLSSDEPVPAPQVIGGGIGISKNGLNVLSRMEASHNKSFPTQGEHDETSDTGIHSDIIREMARRGHPIERWEISTARGFTIVDVNLIPRKLRGPGTSSGSGDSPTRRRSSVTKGDRYMYHSLMIARQACWEILLDRVLDHSPDAVVKKRIVGVIIGDATTSSTIKFEDGTEDSADLVIGADGLRSVVRKAMFETDKVNTQAADDAAHKRRQSDQGWAQAVLRWLGLSGKSGEMEDSTGHDYITPRYEGLVGVGGFVPSSLLESAGHKPGTMSIVFGRNGFFGYGYLTPTDSALPPKLQGTGGTSDDIKDSNPRPSLTPATSKPGGVAGWWSTFSSPTPYPYDAAIDAAGVTSSGKANKPTEFDKPLAVKSLLARHKKWKNPAISAIINYIESSSPTTTSAPSPYPPPPASIYANNDDLTPNRALEACFPTWTTPELPHWTLRGRAVLVGDAAHALQPSSGQGACQALEDAEALALLLKHHLNSDSNSVQRSAAPASSVSRETASSSTAASSATTPAPAKALTTALAQYEALRKPRVHAIYARSQKMSRMKGDMGLLMEWTMYLMIYIMTWFHDDYNDILFEYDLPSEVEKIIKNAEERGSRI